MKLLAASLISFTVVGYAHAGPPELFKTCSNADLSSSNSLVLFDKECSSGYVIPSGVGKLAVSGATISVSQATCNSIVEILDASMGTFGSVEEREQESKRLTNAMSVLVSEIDQSEEKLSAFELAQTALNASVSELADQKAENESQFATECPDGADTSFVCLNLQTQMTKAEREHSAAIRKSNALNSLIESLTKSTAEMRKRLSEMQGTKAQLSSATIDPAKLAEAKSLLAELRSEAGATIAATLKSTVNEDVAALSELNSGNGISFVAMPIIGGSLHAADATATNDYEVSGRARLVVPGLNVDESSDAIKFTNAAAAKLELDSVAACKAFGFSVPSPSDLSGIAKALSANIVAKAYVDYSTIATARINVEMDYNKFYELVVETTSRNGFFRTSTSKSISETLEAESILKVSVENTLGVLTQDQIDALESAMRDRVIQRALSFLNPEYVGVDPKQNPAPATAGAPVAAENLRKCPNVYCQVGAAVLDVAHKIFGGSNTRQQFVQSLGVQSTEVFESGNPITLTADLVFEPVSQ